MSRGIPLILSALAAALIIATPATLDAQGRGNSQARNAGPPFCQSERGHPVHGWRWCAERGFGRWARYDDRRYDSRGDDDWRNDDRSRRASYEREHQDFHRWLDRKYDDLAARRPRDVQYQLQLRAEKQREHDEWHRRMGIRH